MKSPPELDSPIDRPFFISGYLTLISVIQATAFGLFVLSVVKLLENGALWTQLPFLICEYFMIVNVTFGYFAGARDLRWHIGGFDILIPFTLGLAECLAITTLGEGNGSEKYWFAANLLFFFTGIFATLHANRKVRVLGEEYPKTETYFHNRNQLIFGIICIVLTLLFIYIVTLIHHGKITRNTQEVFAWILCAIQIGLFFLIHQLDWKKDFLTTPSTSTSVSAPDGATTEAGQG